MKELLKNKTVQVIMVVIAIMVGYFIFNLVKKFFFVEKNKLTNENIQPPANLNGGGGGTTTVVTTTISPQKAAEYASRVVNDVDTFNIFEWTSLGFAGNDNAVYTEMLALQPADLVLINNEFLKNFNYKYKTIAEFIRDKSSWLTAEQSNFLTKFNASIK